MQFLKLYPTSALGASAYINVGHINRLQVGQVAPEGPWTVLAHSADTPILRLDVEFSTVGEANAWLDEEVGSL